MKFEGFWNEYLELDKGERLYVTAYLFGVFESHFDDHNEDSISKESLYKHIERAINKSKEEDSFLKR